MAELLATAIFVYIGCGMCVYITYMIHDNGRNVHPMANYWVTSVQGLQPHSAPIPTEATPTPLRTLAITEVEMS